jgi:hypothetical protein
MDRWITSRAWDAVVFSSCTVLPHFGVFCSLYSEYDITSESWPCDLVVLILHVSPKSNEKGRIKAHFKKENRKKGSPIDAGHQRIVASVTWLAKASASTP